MKTTDLIRSILDIIDQCESTDDVAEKIPPSVIVAANNNDELQRLKQILDFIDNRDSDKPAAYRYANSPSARVTDVRSVTTDAGGGVNGPKNPSDIRGEHPSMYPDSQHKGS